MKQNKTLIISVLLVVLGVVGFICANLLHTGLTLFLLILGGLSFFSGLILLFLTKAGDVPVKDAFKGYQLKVLSITTVLSLTAVLALIGGVGHKGVDRNQMGGFPGGQMQQMPGDNQKGNQQNNQLPGQQDNQQLPNQQGNQQTPGDTNNQQLAPGGNTQTDNNQSNQTDSNNSNTTQESKKTES